MGFCPERQHRKVVRSALPSAQFYCANHPPLKQKHAFACFRGGQGWIRTTEVADGRFTVCSLWPLGNLPIFIKFGAGDRNRTNNLLITNQLLCLLSYTSIAWCLGADSNHRHRDFQSLALPPELPRHNVAYLFSGTGCDRLDIVVVAVTESLPHISFGDPKGARTPDLQRDRLAY